MGENIILKDVIFEDFINYKKPCMVLEFPFCTFKCEECQNRHMVHSPNIMVNIKTLIQRYIDNNITKAVCCQGLEPFDSKDDLLTFIKAFREQSNDDIVIYTGYMVDEVQDILKELKQYSNIIIKFGRYIPNKPSVYDETLGVTLASNNQYGAKIENILC